MTRARLSRICLLLALLFACTWGVEGCQIPVFRYALERWAPAEYLVSVVPGEGGLTEPETKAVELLRAAPHDAQNPVNLAVKVEPPAPGAAGPAQIALTYPHKLRDPRRPIWQAALTVENVRRLLESPARAELRRRLLAGESAIWVLVESGDRASDDAAAEALTRAIEDAQSTLKLPDGVITQAEAAARSGARANEHADALRSDLPLKIAFSLLRLSRHDPAEEVLLAMLTHVESDLGDYLHQPMAFPVFGRGRVLEPLIAKGVNRSNVMEHSGYLCGACSCEVKDQNPGIDLLLAANWEPVDTTPELEIVRISPRAETAPAERRPPRLLLGASVLSLGLGVWLLRRHLLRIGSR